MAKTVTKVKAKEESSNKREKAAELGKLGAEKLKGGASGFMKFIKETSIIRDIVYMLVRVLKKKLFMNIRALQIYIVQQQDKHYLHHSKNY